MVKTTSNMLKFGFLIPGIIMLVIAGGLYYVHSNFVATGVQVQGTVIKSQRHLGVDAGNDVFAPIISFTTLDGQTEQFEVALQTSPPAHQIGDKVPVIYDPKKPSNANINSVVDLYLAEIIVGGIGFVFTVIGVIVFFLIGSRQKNSGMIQ